MGNWSREMITLWILRRTMTFLMSRSMTSFPRRGRAIILRTSLILISWRSWRLLRRRKRPGNGLASMNLRSLKRKSVAKKRERSVSRLQSEFKELGVTGLEVDNPNTHFNRARSSSRARPIKKMRLEEGSRNGSVARSQSGLRDASQGAKLDKQQKKRDKKGFARMGKAGESDRRIQEKKPKNLFCGKRGIGKNDRR